MAFLEVQDLAPFASIDDVKADAMIQDAEAMAVLAAPCLATMSDLDAGQVAGVRAVLRGAILRWHEAGAGALQSQQAGPYMQTFDSRQNRRGMFWPSEISQLQDICGGSSSSSGAFGIDTVGALLVTHLDTCSLRFGGDCSCGAILTGAGPLYEV